MSNKLSSYIKGTPKPYQIDFINFAYRYRYVLNGSKPGTGKTYMCLAPCFILGGKTLIVCPSYLKHTWKDEINKWEISSHSIYIVKTKITADRLVGAKKSDFTIVSHDMVKYLITEEFDNLIVDEIHFLKNPKALKTQSLTKLMAKKENRPKLTIFASGTPILNNHTEWYVYFRLLSLSPFFNGIRLKESFDQFARSICNFTERTFKVFNKKINKSMVVTETKYSGLKDPDKLNRLLEHKYFCAEVDEAGLPEITIKDVYFEDIQLPSNLAKQLEDDFNNLAESDRAISSVKKDNALLKTQATLSLIGDIKKYEKAPIVVFSDHVDSCYELERDLILQNYKVRVITGSVADKKRHEYVDELQIGLIDFLIATIDSASTGFTMTSSCKVIINDCPWKVKSLEQAIKRVHRISQKDTVTVYMIHCGEIDFRINSVLRRKITDIGGF